MKTINIQIEKLEYLGKIYPKRIEYILEGNLENPMNFFSPFQPEREFKVYNVNVHKLYAVEYINTVLLTDNSDTTDELG